MEGILLDAEGGLNAAELCDVQSAAGAASVAMCCRMASWSLSTLISIFSKCSAVSSSTVCSLSPLATNVFAYCGMIVWDTSTG